MSRSDGRQPGQLRPVRLEPGYLDFAEGSCWTAFGRTQVLCAATIEAQVPQWLRGQGRGWVTAEYSMLPRSTPERTRREAQAGRPSGRTHEIQRLIGRALRSVVDLTALGERMVTVDCDCIVADGGTRTASITGAFVALAQAVPQAIVDHIAAVSVGVVDGVTCLDLCYEEDVRAEVDMNVVMTGRGAYVEVQGTAEHQPFDRGALDAMLASAQAGISELVELQRAVL